MFQAQLVLPMALSGSGAASNKKKKISWFWRRRECFKKEKEAVKNGCCLLLWSGTVSVLFCLALVFKFFRVMALSGLCALFFLCRYFSEGAKSVQERFVSIQMAIVCRKRLRAFFFRVKRGNIWWRKNTGY